MTNIEVKYTAKFDKDALTLAEFNNLVNFLTQGEPVNNISWIVNKPHSTAMLTPFSNITIEEGYYNDAITGLQTIINQPIEHATGK